MNQHVMPDVAMSRPIGDGYKTTVRPFAGKDEDTIIDRADRELTAAFVEDTKAYRVAGNADTALIEFDSTPLPEALLKRPADFSLGIPGAIQACCCAQQSAEYYSAQNVADMLVQVRYRKKQAPRNLRMREIVKAWGSRQDALAALQKAMASAEAHCRATSSVFNDIVWRISCTQVSSLRGIALKSLILLELEGVGSLTMLTPQERDDRDMALRRSLARDIVRTGIKLRFAELFALTEDQQIAFRG